MSNELEQLQAENVALRAALEQTLLKTRERVVREIARAALSSPTPAAERIKALEEEHRLAVEMNRYKTYTAKWLDARDAWRAAVEDIWLATVAKVKE